MKVYVTVTTVKGKIHDVEVFHERWRAASRMMRVVETLNAEGDNPDPVVWTDEDASGVYWAKVGDIVGQMFEREV